jgi:hypothetical protein
VYVLLRINGFLLDFFDSLEMLFDVRRERIEEVEMQELDPESL